MKKINPICGFRERLEAAIWDSGLDLNVICRKAEISRSGLWSYRFGNRTPSADSVKGLCKALNVSADYMLGLSQYKNIKELIELISTNVAEENYKKGYRQALKDIKEGGNEDD